MGIKDPFIRALSHLAALSIDRTPRTVADLERLPPRHVLFIRTDRTGDLLSSSPLIAAFHERWPHARLVLLGGPKNRAVRTLMPYVERAPLEFERHPLSWARLAAWLPRQGFDVAVSLRGEVASGALIALASRAALRVVPNTTRTVVAFNLVLGAEEPHQLLRYWLAARQLGVTLREARPMVEVPASTVPEAETVIRAAAPPGSAPLVGIGVPGRVSARQRADAPPPRALLDVVRAVSDVGWRVLLFGFGAELVEAEAIRAAVPAVAVMPPVPLPVMAGVLQRLDLYVSSYTGPLHLADGVGTATVAIGTPSRHFYWRPLGPRHRVVAAEPVSAVTPASVVAAVADALGAGAGLSALPATR